MSVMASPLALFTRARPRCSHRSASRAAVASAAAPGAGVADGLPVPAAPVDVADQQSLTLTGQPIWADHTAAPVVAAGPVQRFADQQRRDGGGGGGGAVIGRRSAPVRSSSWPRPVTTGTGKPGPAEPSSSNTARSSRLPRLWRAQARPAAAVGDASRGRTARRGCAQRP